MRGTKWKSDAERFWAKVDMYGPETIPGLGPCWIWTASTRAGYGQFKVGGKRGRMAKAHRVSWEFANGPLPVSSDSVHGTCVCHRCDNPRCVNPSHLFVATQRENITDMDSKGRRGVPDPEKLRSALRGRPGNPRKLTAETVRAIRAARTAGEKQCVVARRYGVSVALIYGIDRNLVWRHVA